MRVEGMRGEVNEPLIPSVQLALSCALLCRLIADFSQSNVQRRHSPLLSHGRHLLPSPVSSSHPAPSSLPYGIGVSAAQQRSRVSQNTAEATLEG